MGLILRCPHYLTAIDTDDKIIPGFYGNLEVLVPEDLKAKRPVAYPSVLNRASGV